MFRRISFKIRRLGSSRIFSITSLLLFSFALCTVSKSILFKAILISEVLVFDVLFSKNGRNKVYIDSTAKIDGPLEDGGVSVELTTLSYSEKKIIDRANKKQVDKAMDGIRKKGKRTSKGYGWKLILTCSAILIFTYFLGEIVIINKFYPKYKIETVINKNKHSYFERILYNEFTFIFDPPINLSISRFSLWLLTSWKQRTFEIIPSWDSRNNEKNSNMTQNIHYTEIEFDTFISLNKKTGSNIAANLPSAKAALGSWKKNIHNNINSDKAEFTSDDLISVVIPVFNEEEFILKTIIYTIESTPKTLLGEIIVVDDCSRTPVINVLEHQLPVKYKKYIRVIRITKNQGLIRSKIVGADAAFGPNIFFLDGHCRPKPGWSEALVRSIRENYKRIVCPIVQSISSRDWSDIGTAGAKMMIEWNFEFHWYDDGLKEIPITSGGILMITKRWWEESGKYDPGMLFWGGENIEQSFRVWLCGGEIHVVRNSLVGHIFERKNLDERNNDFEYKKLLIDNMNINHQRTAFVWLSEQYYETYFKNFHIFGKKNIQEIDGIGERLAIKYKLNCKPFSWFVDKFRPAFERQGELHSNFYHVQHVKSKLCLSIKNKKINNTFSINTNKNNQIPMTVVPNDVSKYNKKETDEYDIIILDKCNINDESQKWSFILGNRMLYNHLTKRCLDKVESIQGYNITNYKQSFEKIGSNEMIDMEVKTPLLYECDWNLVMRARNINQFWTWSELHENGVIINWNGQEHLSNITGGADEFIVPEGKKNSNESYCLFSNTTFGTYQDTPILYRKCGSIDESILFKKIWKKELLSE